MKHFYIKNKKEILLFGIALSFGLLFLVITYFFGSERFLWTSDAEGYFDLMQNFIGHHGFYHDILWGPQVLRTPMYTIFTSLFYYVVPSLLFVIFIQNILAALSVVLLYKLGELIFNKWTGAVASFLFIVESQRLQVTNQLMSETLFVFLFLLSLFFIFKFLIKKDDRKYLIIGGVLFGLAILTRPIIQFLPFAIPIAFLWYGYKNKKIKEYFIKSVLLIFIIFIIVSPWLVRNKIHFNRFMLSSAGGVNLYSVNAAHFLEGMSKRAGEHKELYGEMFNKAIEDLEVELDRTNWTKESLKLFAPKYEEYFVREAFSIIKEDPLNYSIFHLKRVATFFIESSASRSYSVVFYDLNPPANIFYPYMFWGGRFLWAFMSLAVILSLLFKNNKRDASMFLLLIFLYFAILSSPNWDIPRMREPVTPLFLLVFANGIYILKNKVKHLKF